ncbi:HET-domain-containing protein [Hyaloscypha variabilis F]|uniref:HET-domain-containing protein n=1 Tax=Hyaloscypha variabilis (strain UAMH 11265 / GT02V1 / F) TaxID=1149755 RepID=A0A2J6RAX0_HYAVF|nr:HET-domain-containing protein [Hyaloscypha variabilis F]
MTSNLESASFQYKSLTEPDSFRLILLQPSSSHDVALQCNLLHTTISKCDRDIIDHYTALSYVWGDPNRTGSIYIDGHSFTINVTLEAALRDLRDPSRVLRIWADALCIDQSNLTERSSQVSLMAQIYSTAHHTVIHLGTLTGNYETILLATPSNTTGILSNKVTASDLKKLAVDGLLRLPWFSRVWVFQELVLSRDPWVQCGNLRARWIDVCNILVAPGRGSNQGGAKELQVLADMNYARGVSKQKMLVHLRARRGLGATDPRDFIFAHMFLAADTDALIQYLQVDYTKSCAEVFEAAARYLLEEVGPEGPVKFFPDITRNKISKIEGLASWAPDWTLPSSGLVSMYCENLARRLQLNPKLHYAFVGNPLVLAYVGYQVDVVSDISFVLPNPSELDTAARKRYQKAGDDLEVLYGAGAWWSGDENGQHRHIDLRGKEAQHEKLCLKLADEWLHVIRNDNLRLWKDMAEDEAASHQRFLPQFRDWLETRSKEGRIMVGGDSDGMESLMWLYLRLEDYPAVLTERRFTITKSGNLGVVPKQAKAGDIIVFLAGSFVAMVLRPDFDSPTEDLELGIRTAFEGKKNIKDDPRKGSRLPVEMETLPVQKCTLVGECYVEGEIGWKYGEDLMNKCTVYALR